MKKIFALLLASLVLLCACTAEDVSDSSAPDQSIASQDESVADVSSVDTSDISDTSSDTSSEDPEPNMDPIDFEYKTVYTDKLRTDGIYPYGYCIKDKEGLEKSNGPDDNGNPVYATDVSVDGVPSYDEWIQKYTDEWFEDHALAVCVVENEYGKLPAVRLVEAGDGKITVHVSGVIHSENVEKEQTYHIFVEIDKADVGEISDVEVLIDGGDVYGKAIYISLEFFDAYVMGEIKPATQLMDSPDNRCLEWFSTKENCIGRDKVTYFADEIIACGYDSETDLHYVRIDIAYDIKNEGNINYMTLTLVAEVVHGGDWKVSYFDFEA